jgi:hypothetical protein
MIRETSAFQMFNNPVLKEMVGSTSPNIMFVIISETVLNTSKTVMAACNGPIWMLLMYNGTMNFIAQVASRASEKFLVDVSHKLSSSLVLLVMRMSKVVKAAFCFLKLPHKLVLLLYHQDMPVWNV